MTEGHRIVRRARVRGVSGAPADIELDAQVVLLQPGVWNAARGSLLSLMRRGTAQLRSGSLGRGRDDDGRLTKLLELQGGQRLLPPYLQVRPRLPRHLAPFQGLEQAPVDVQHVLPGHASDRQSQQKHQDLGHVEEGSTRSPDQWYLFET